MRRLVLAAAAVMLCVPLVRALEIPLTVTERAGENRVGNHVNSGIPLPQGAYKDASKFGLYTADGVPAPAQFVVRERWLADDSVKFMTVHFRVDLKAKGIAKFVVKDTPPELGRPFPTVKVEEADGTMTVNTGAIKFTVKKGEWHVFDAVEFGGKSVLKGPGKVVFKAEYGTTPNGYTTKAPEGLPVHDATAVVKEIKVDENAPGRAVVLVKGSFQQDGADKLDFQARYYALAGSPSVRVAFTVVNRQGKDWNEFVGIRSLGLELPLALAGKKSFALGASEGDDLAGEFADGGKVVMLQPNSVAYKVSGAAEATGKCKELETKRVGWLSLAGEDAAVTTAVRWFWQLHPKGLAATADGTVKVYLVPPQKEKAPAPEEEYTEPQTRIDLYTGGAKTHEILFAFHKPAGAADARARAMGVMEPLFAACPTEWYCQKTWAFGKLYDAKLENFRPEVRDLVRRYETNVDRSFTCVTIRTSGKAKKDQKIITPFEIKEKKKDGTLKDKVYCSAQKLEEYGWMNFGSHVEHGSKVKAGDSLNTQWDGNYYDFPRACVVRFVRTGMMHYFDEAQSSGLHLADIDIVHWHPKKPELSGIEHVCPNVGHFRTFWPGRKFQPSGNVHSCKSQSLYELYNLTGDAWYREAAILSGTYLTNHKGGNVRGMGNRIMGLLCAYRATREEKFKTAWKDDVVNRTAAGAVKKIGEGGTGRWDQAWQYGLGAEAMHDYLLITGDATVAKALTLAADSLMKCPWSSKQRSAYNGLSGFTVPVFGYAYEVTGDAKYLRYGITRLEKTANNYAGRSKSWAQMARISPQLLYYLAVDYKPPKPVYGGKEEADPPEAALGEAPAEEKKPPADVGEM